MASDSDHQTPSSASAPGGAGSPEPGDQPEIADRYRALFEEAPVMYVVTRNVDGVPVIEDCNKLFLATLGYQRDEVLGRRLAEFYTSGSSDLLSTGGYRRALEGEFASEERELVAREGGVVSTLLRAVPTTDLSREVTGTWAMYVDITERKRAEAALRRSEERLRQAQKMEAIGQLAGGIAHDYNNLLTAIQVCNRMVLQTLEPDDPRREDLEEALAAAERCAALTRQLLAFGRRQVVRPTVLNLNDVVRDTEKMLRRLIGEHIELVTTLATELECTRADAGQLQQVILNLAINARDAMPDLGELAIETGNVFWDGEHAAPTPPGEATSHVVLRVRDTGVGMDADTRGRAFEPFFTTKGKSLGTGLGLATVYGIVQQSEGDITVASEPGRGTTFTIYFPRVDAAAPQEPPPEPVGPSPRGSETVLLVEDEPVLRAAVERVLRTLGYRVLTAEDGRAALEMVLAARHPIDLVVTDVVMPRMGGPELVRNLAVHAPRIKVLFVSGYADRPQERLLVSGKDAAFLHKPFTPSQLARKVREVLARSSG